MVRALRQYRQREVAVTQVRSGLNVHVTGRRVVATIIDGLLFGIVSGVFAEAFGTRTTSSGFAVTRLSTGGSFLLLVVAVLYYVLLEGIVGRTLGKMITGVRVVDEVTGNPPGIGKAAIRTLLRIIDGLFVYLVGFIVVLSSDRRRRLGDMAAKTLVVRV
jgi:uncharacterized RDD family membrane protein YckC